MIVLLDTATPLCKLTLVDGDTRFESQWQADRQLAKGLLGYLRDQLAQHGKTFHDISGIGVMKGPGSFTGLRIGLTVLNTIADTNSIPIVGEMGEDWHTKALGRLQNNENDKIVLPFYDRGVTITTPRK